MPWVYLGSCAPDASKHIPTGNYSGGTNWCEKMRAYKKGVLPQKCPQNNQSRTVEQMAKAAANVREESRG